MMEVAMMERPNVGRTQNNLKMWNFEQKEPLKQRENLNIFSQPFAAWTAWTAILMTAALEV